MAEEDSTFLELEDCPPKKRLKRDNTQLNGDKKSGENSNKDSTRVSEDSKAQYSKTDKCISCSCFVNKRSLGDYNPLRFTTTPTLCLSSSLFSTTKDFIVKKLYTSILKVAERPSEESINGGHGAIFNLEFSPNNQYLLAACEQNDILVYDPWSFRKVHVIPNAHREGVNCISFLDTRMFATCSDDENIAIWDIRNLKSRVFTLTGHASWVKSINYDKSSGNLISSAFDDTVRCWDLKKNSDDSIKGEIILKVPFLTRTKLSSRDENKLKLYVATTTGLLFVIHNLDMTTLRKDTREELKNVSSSYLPNSHFNPLRKTNSAAVNRIELIRSFPSGSKPWCIASIQLHPTKNMVLSRYTNKTIDSEWSMVHSLNTNSGHTSELVPSFNLCGFIEEPNSAKGYIKELCYSKEGWIICSPFGNGVRLLALNDKEDCTTTAQELTELKMITGHKSPVLTTRFSPYYPLLASGCLGGKMGCKRLIAST